MQADLCLCLHMHKAGFLIPQIFSYIHVDNLSLSVHLLGLVSRDYDGTQSLAPFSVAPEFSLAPASPALVPLSQLVPLSLSSPLQADPLSPPVLT